MKKDLKELREARLAANEKLGEFYLKVANREMTAEEKMELEMLNRELNQYNEAVRIALSERECEMSGKALPQVDKNKTMREYLRNVRNGKAEREILLSNVNHGDTNTIEASGAINLTIEELIPTLHEGLDLPADLNMMTGVVGNEVWPVSINDAEMEEVGEVANLTDQVLDFAKITPVQKRVGLTIPVSNMAIDNAAFDLMAFVQTKFTIALRKYLASKLYSQAEFSGNKGPFSGLTPAGNIDLSGNAYKAILKAVAAFSDKGFFEGDVTIIMDRETEAELKATPKLAGAAAGFVVEDGRCAGYPYIVTHYLNTELASDHKTLVPTEDKYIGIGYFQWFAVQSHGTTRLSIDATSQSVAKKNVTAITLNSAWSFTDLSKFINGGTPTGYTNPTYPTQAFALYKVVDGTVTTEETTTT
jgi:HK97 family phage major capsid protein